MSIEAMKQMVEALNDAHLDARMPRPLVNKYLAALEAGRQAIADAEKQEPKCVVIVEVFGKDWRLEYMSLPVGRHKLYTQQYLYTRPQPKREWVWLTPEEITGLKHNGKRYISSQDFARAVETLSKEKNT